MKRLFWRFSGASSILLLTLAAAQAFDISVYYDPVSMIRRQAEWDGGWGNCAGEPDYHVWVSSVANNTQAIQWWRDMGVNKSRIFIG